MNHQVTMAITGCLTIAAMFFFLGKKSKVPLVTQDELVAAQKAGDDILILDVRSIDEFDSGHIKNAVNIPVNELHERIQELKTYKEKDVIVHCAMGPRAYKAEAFLLQSGFTRVKHLKGDMNAWRKRGLPIVKELKE